MFTVNEIKIEEIDSCNTTEELNSILKHPDINQLEKGLNEDNEEDTTDPLECDVSAQVSCLKNFGATLRPISSQIYLE